MKRSRICIALMLAGLLLNAPVFASNAIQNTTTQEHYSCELPWEEVIRILKSCSNSTEIGVSCLIDMYAHGEVEIQEISEGTYEVVILQVSGNPIIAVIADSL